MNVWKEVSGGKREVVKASILMEVCRAEKSFFFLELDLAAQNLK